MKEIKSSYFITKIFDFINEKRKLDIVKYNKNYQNLLDLDIINYRTLSGRFIVKEENGIIKEYDDINYNIIYEGEYLNGKRHGKGKEYEEFLFKYLLFEGEYKNGKRYKGKEYYRDGNIKYEGEYLNGKIWTGKVYDKGENIISEINQGKGYIREMKNEYGFYFIFEGYYLNGERNGEGKEYNDDGYLIFKGEYKNGKKWNGNGYNKSYNIVYEINNGKGYIKEYDNYGKLEFEGEYYNGEKNGKGKEYHYNGNLEFAGEYLNGKKHGKGKEYDYNRNL